MRRRWKTLLGEAMVACVVLAGCDGQSSGPVEQATLIDRASGTNRSNADLAAYDEVGTLASYGGQVALPDGTRISVMPGATWEAVALGIRPASRPPEGDHDGIAVSDWTECETDLLDAWAAPDAPFVVEVPASPPPEAIGHPGLQLTLVLPGAQSFPIDGNFDADDGLFRAELPALPPRFAFAVTYDAAMQRLDSIDVSEGVLDSPLQSALGEGGWSTVDFVLDFNGNRITIDQARKVARVARQAARVYANQGYLEPFLYKETTVLGPRWHIHLTDKGSNFNSSHDPAAVDEAGRFGRLYVSKNRIDASADDELGSVLASVAHEMFHAILYSYRLPYQCFNYQSDGQTWCYPSYSGFNEGAATAAGYFIDQGTPKPRPSESPFGLNAPFGYFDPNAQSLAYRNQDFFVFLLRVGGLQNIATMLSALAATVMPAAGASSYQCLSAYAAALEPGGAGLGIGFTELLGGYTANRGFLREPEGYIWPDEPAGGKKGAQHVLDRSLFGPVRYEIDPRDCEEDPDAEIVECTADLEAMAPMSGGLVTIDIESLAEDWEIVPDRVAVSATTTVGKVAYWIVGETDGAGAEGGYGDAMDGAEAELPGGASEWSRAHVLVAQGAGKGDVSLRITLGAEARGATYVGTGTMVDTLSAGGMPATCTQPVTMTLEVDHIPGWVELNWEAQELQFHLDVDDNATCSLSQNLEQRSMWVSGHPQGQFSLSYSSLTSPWLHGTYDKNSATGQGQLTEGDFTSEITFSLQRTQ